MDKFHNCMKTYISDKIFSNLSSQESTDKFVSLLFECGYKIIACDFDSTMIELHSGGYLDPKLDRKVLETVSQDFKSMCKSLEKFPLTLVIVTFSDELFVQGHPRYISGDKMVKLALEYSNCKADVKKVYAYYPRFYDSPKSYKKLGLDKPMPSYKEFHLRKICSDFNVKMEEIILIDDDVNNCKNAKLIGATALHVKGLGFKMTEVDLL